MTSPSASSDLLMFLPSARRWPVAPERFARSEPARSTRLIFDARRGWWPPPPSAAQAAPATVCVTLSSVIACEREDVSLSFVRA
eukprot:3570433-Prymnesium_polylepis.1